MIIVTLPWENEEEDGESGGATRDKTFTTAEASGDGVKGGVAEKQESEGGKTVNGGSVSGINTESSIVVLIGNNFSLKNGNRVNNFKKKRR